MFILLSTLIGGGLGAIFWLILDLTKITNEFAVLGIGIGIGAAYGLILGGFLLIALRFNIVEDYELTYKEVHLYIHSVVV